MDTHRASTEKYTSAYGATNGLRSEKQQSGLAGRSEIDQELAELTDHGKMPALHGTFRRVVRGGVAYENTLPDGRLLGVIVEGTLLEDVGAGVGELLLDLVVGRPGRGARL